MAQDAVDRVAATLGHAVACRTTDLPLVGATARVGAEAGRLRRRFGAEADAVAACGPAEPIAPDVPVLKCEVGWAIQAEGAVTAEDILDRRLRVDLVPAWRDATASYVDEVLTAG
jgi:glycerol-3-phosphate dehydrogenase